jgi:hypothetical protein
VCLINVVLDHGVGSTTLGASAKLMSWPVRRRAGGHYREIVNRVVSSREPEYVVWPVKGVVNPSKSAASSWLCR